MAAVEDRLPSVAFNISINWKMPFQKVSIEVKECWIQCSEFDAFQMELKSLIKNDGGEITLHDLSKNPVLSFIKSEKSLTTRLFAQDTSDMGKTVLEVNGYPNELEEVRFNLEAFEKWW
ncbi:MAG: hypothetical protein HWE11_14240 [Gammaproteobacteria bacterium]|nr:hypothetical protein [Gammaproteobacteria bacterium]